MSPGVGGNKSSSLQATTDFPWGGIKAPTSSITVSKIKISRNYELYVLHNVTLIQFWFRYTLIENVLNVDNCSLMPNN